MSEPEPRPASPSARLRTLLLVLVAGATPLALWDASLANAIGRAAQSLAEGDEAQRAQAAAELRGLGAAAVPDLVRLFIVPSDGVTAVAHGGGASKVAGPLTVPIMEFLRTQRDPQTVAALVTAVGDPDPDVRHYSGLLLAWMGAPAVGPVQTLLREGRTVHERTSAARILGLMGADGVPALPALEAALQDEASDVRLMARWSLAQLAPGNDLAFEMVRQMREETR